jgi:hypothetical protein
VSNSSSNGNSSNVSGTSAHANSSCYGVENLTAAHFVLHVSSSAYSSYASSQQHHHTSKAGSRSRSSSVYAVKIAPKDSTTTAVNNSISSSSSVCSSTSSSAGTAVSAKTRRHSLKHMITETQLRSGMMNSSSANSKHTMLSSSSSYNSKDIELDLQCTTPYERSRWQLALLLAVHGSNGSGVNGSLTVHDVNRVLRGATQTAVKQQVHELADAVSTARSSDQAAADLRRTSNAAQLSSTSRKTSSRAFALTALAVAKFNSSKQRNRQLSLSACDDDEHLMQQQQQQQQPQQQWPVSV